ncbi:hypothetical protein BPOR_0131g00100 [Botrytis porri]|uniref:Uncharacterized protein n=1 Tax=Botrytis porri TaxID=87229 RepID=A0A4Z1KWS8_9HELO|nr:hypothetical protein BPOR_0131g00100 [Botrytis porri]
MYRTLGRKHRQALDPSLAFEIPQLSGVSENEEENQWNLARGSYNTRLRVNRLLELLDDFSRLVQILIANSSIQRKVMI